MDTEKQVLVNVLNEVMKDLGEKGWYNNKITGYYLTPLEVIKKHLEQLEA